jgi:hypothetical protein
LTDAWTLRGELTLSCNCTVFCPCVVSLGQHDPTEGYCQTWAGIRVDDGRFNEVDLSGLNVGLIADIPGPLTRGNWTAGLFVDERASIHAVKALTKIFTGRAGGSTGLLKILVSSFLGVRTVPITYKVEGQTRIFSVEKMIDGAVTPIQGKDPDKPVMIHNSGYWIGPDVMVSRADRSRMRAFGRNWNFAGRSAEICAIDWGNDAGR